MGHLTAEFLVLVLCCYLGHCHTPRMYENILETPGHPLVHETNTRYDSTDKTSILPTVGVFTLSGMSDAGHPHQRPEDENFPEPLHWPEGLKASKTSPFRSLGQPDWTRNRPEVSLRGTTLVTVR